MPQADNMLFRAELIKTWDDKKQQGFEVWGRDGERLGGTTGENTVPRLQEYGFTSHPPKGSQGMLLGLSGNPDNAMAIGFEHPDFRPKNLLEGEWKHYTKFSADHYMYAKEDKWIIRVGTATVELFADGTVHINRPGAT